MNTDNFKENIKINEQDKINHVYLEKVETDKTFNKKKNNRNFSFTPNSEHINMTRKNKKVPPPDSKEYTNFSKYFLNYIPEKDYKKYNKIILVDLANCAMRYSKEIYSFITEINNFSDEILMPKLKENKEKFSRFINLDYKEFDEPLKGNLRNLPFKIQNTLYFWLLLLQKTNENILIVIFKQNWKNQNYSTYYFKKKESPHGELMLFDIPTKPDNGNKSFIFNEVDDIALITFYLYIKKYYGSSVHIFSDDNMKWYSINNSEIYRLSNIHKNYSCIKKGKETWNIEKKGHKNCLVPIPSQQNIHSRGTTPTIYSRGITPEHNNRKKVNLPPGLPRPKRQRTDGGKRKKNSLNNIYFFAKI